MNENQKDKCNLRELGSAEITRISTDPTIPWGVTIHCPECPADGVEVSIYASPNPDHAIERATRRTESSCDLIGETFIEPPGYIPPTDGLPRSYEDEQY